MLKSPLNLNLSNHVEDDYNTLLMNCAPTVWASLYEDNDELHVEQRDAIMQYSRSTYFPLNRHASYQHLPLSRTDKFIENLYDNPRYTPISQKLKASLLTVLTLILVLIAMPMYWHHTYLNTEIFHPQTLDVLDILQQEFDARNPTGPVYQSASNEDGAKAKMIASNFARPEPDLGPDYERGVYMYRTLDDRLTRYNVAMSYHESNLPFNETELLLLARERDAIRGQQAAQASESSIPAILSTNSYYMEDDAQLLAMAAANAANGVTAKVKAATQAAADTASASDQDLVLSAQEHIDDLSEIESMATTAQVIAAASERSAMHDDLHGNDTPVDNQPLIDIMSKSKASKNS